MGSEVSLETFDVLGLRSALTAPEDAFLRAVVDFGRRDLFAVPLALSFVRVSFAFLGTVLDYFQMYRLAGERRIASEFSFSIFAATESID